MIYLYNKDDDRDINTLAEHPSYTLFNGQPIGPDDTLVICQYLNLGDLCAMCCNHIENIRFKQTSARTQNECVDNDVYTFLQTHERCTFLAFCSWETRCLMKVRPDIMHAFLKRLNIPASKLIISTSEFRYMHQPIENVVRLVSYDWKYLAALSDTTTRRVQTDVPKSKMFVMLNRRSDGMRYGIAVYLFAKHRKHYHMSYLQKTSGSSREFMNVVMANGVAMHHITAFNASLPILLDNTHDLARWDTTEDVYSYLNDAYFFLMFETNYVQDHAQISEKTYKSILSGMPFILFVNHPGILKHLRSLGFKTFAPIIDESYDDEADILTRYRSLIRLIDTMCYMNPQEREVMYSKCRPIIQHNLDVLKNRVIPALSPWHN